MKKSHKQYLKKLIDTTSEKFLSSPKKSNIILILEGKQVIVERNEFIKKTKKALEKYDFDSQHFQLLIKKKEDK
jgi:hypothetical protein